VKESPDAPRYTLYVRGSEKYADLEMLQSVLLEPLAQALAGGSARFSVPWARSGTAGRSASMPVGVKDTEKTRLVCRLMAELWQPGLYGRNRSVGRVSR
jgi:hypothetical protein